MYPLSKVLVFLLALGLGAHMVTCLTLSPQDNIKHAAPIPRSSNENSLTLPAGRDISELDTDTRHDIHKRSPVRGNPRDRVAAVIRQHAQDTNSKLPRGSQNEVARKRITIQAQADAIRALANPNSKVSDADLTFHIENLFRHLALPDGISVRAVTDLFARIPKSATTSDSYEQVGNDARNMELLVDTLYTMDGRDSAESKATAIRAQVNNERKTVHKVKLRDINVRDFVAKLRP